MIQRFLEQEELVTTALCLADHSNMCLTGEEKILMRKAVSVLEPFEQATRELSSDNFSTLSKVLPLVHLIQHMLKYDKDINTLPLAQELQKQIQKRVPALEEIYIIGVSTLLDPRFKSFAFADKDAVRKIEERLVARMSAMGGREEEEDLTDSGGQTEEAQTQSIWACFDSKIHDYMTATSRPRGARPYLEMRRYNEESPLKRDADPLAWWREIEALLPKLQVLAKNYLCIPATSVPSERLFSKAGELICDRRSCIKPDNVNMILFLNKNLKG
ncbi:Zinc finger bed domaincontaining protein 1like [haplochromis burtoni] [Plakobranchus ocellatus]|uniref:Zinc finger bed domaincontaining protein 1like [haplochromis burtoni] n=1 Tax=Plakobranchus ocellatus TaxID=259542 RepID=A0AAV3ZUJ8_9GAST|nr:Zinc finger bed domaincontaining protein 1like [haplochromis burtoni] [Plakobranchus ocellatus]